MQYLDLNSTCITDDKRNKLTSQLIRIRNWTFKDEIMQQTMKLLKYISTDYFVIILNTEATQESVRFKCQCNQLFMLI